jgi:cell division protein FtsI (penicillin-binding protein 3)
VYPTGASVAHLIGLVNIDNQGIAGMEKWLDNNGLADLHRAGFATDRLQRPVELSIDLRSTRCATNREGEENTRPRQLRVVSNVRTARSSRWCRCRISIRTSRAACAIPPD